MPNIDAIGRLESQSSKVNFPREFTGELENMNISKHGPNHDRQTSIHRLDRLKSSILYGEMGNWNNRKINPSFRGSRQVMQLKFRRKKHADFDEQGEAFVHVVVDSYSSSWWSSILMWRGRLGKSSRCKKSPLVLIDKLLIYTISVRACSHLLKLTSILTWYFAN